MKTKTIFLIGLVLTICGAALIDAGILWTGWTVGFAGVLALLLAPVIAGAINTNDGNGF